MRILLVKTSSMGDIIHTLPALSDAATVYPEIQFDWLIEAPFACIPTWHPNVARVIPVSLRAWRKHLFAKETYAEMRTLKKLLREQSYDLILDAQGLVKSAFVSLFAKGVRAGLDFNSARENLASFAYQKKYQVNFYQHAVVRMRSLFSLALDYALPQTAPNFAIQKPPIIAAEQPYLVFLPNTTWRTKQWPEEYWVKLAQLAAQYNLQVKISGGNAEEVARAERIAAKSSNVTVLAYSKIPQMLAVVSAARGVISVDTGFGHLAAACNVPTFSLYGATNPFYTGALGQQSWHLRAAFPCAPCIKRTCNYKGPTLVQPACFGSISVESVWRKVSAVIEM